MNTPVHLPGLPDGADHDAVVAQMIRRARSAGFNAWWQRVEAVGFCANPIHLAGRDEPAANTRSSPAATTDAPRSARRARICTPVTPGSSSTPACAVDTTTSPPP